MICRKLCTECELLRNEGVHFSFDADRVPDFVTKYILMFWETKSDVNSELVSSTIRRNRFLEIHQYLHTCDNVALPEGDKFGKLRQCFDTLNESFSKNSKYL